MNSFAKLLTESASLASPEVTALQDSTLQESRQLADFLAATERRAFRIAQIALRHDQDALDAVQDAMLRPQCPQRRCRTRLPACRARP